MRGDQCLEVEESSWNLEDLLSTAGDACLSDNSRSPSSSSDYGSLGEGSMSTTEEEEVATHPNLSLLDDLDLTSYLTGIPEETNELSLNTMTLMEAEPSCDQDIQELVDATHDNVVVEVEQPRAPSGKRMPTRSSSRITSTISTIEVPPEILAKPVKTSYTEDWASEEVVERNRKNAIQARINRQKKKQYIQSMEGQIDELSGENKELKKHNVSLVKDKSALEEEVEYLKSVLANQSTLAGLLQNINSVSSVRLSTSFRRSSVEADHDYQKPAKRRRVATPASMSGGVCLHVENQNVSLEFCSKCARMARGADYKEGKL